MLSRAQSATHNSATRVSANCSLSPGASAGSLGRGLPTGLAAAGGLSPQTAGRWAHLGFLPPEGSVLGSWGTSGRDGGTDRGTPAPTYRRANGLAPLEWKARVRRPNRAWMCCVLRPQHEKGMVAEEPGPSGGWWSFEGETCKQPVIVSCRRTNTCTWSVEGLYVRPWTLVSLLLCIFCPPLPLFSLVGCLGLLWEIVDVVCHPSKQSCPPSQFCNALAVSHCNHPTTVSPERNSGWRKTGSILCLGYYWPSIVKMHT